MSEFELLVDGVNFGEGPRWRDGVLWYSDFYQAAIYTVTLEGERTAIYEGLGDQPSGLGWMPDGSLLVVSMLNRQILRSDGPAGAPLMVHADLSDQIANNCNDMVVAADGTAYVGNFGFALDKGEPAASTHIAIVRPDGSVTLDETEVIFPNGSVITPDGSTLIVGETFGAQYRSFAIQADGSLGETKVWASTPNMAPDGCALDADGGIWFADATGSQIVRVLEGGEITHRLPTPMPVYACELGGADGRTLFALCAPDAHPDNAGAEAAGQILTTTVPHGR